MQFNINTRRKIKIFTEPNSDFRYCEKIDSNRIALKGDSVIRIYHWKKNIILQEIESFASANVFISKSILLYQKKNGDTLTFYDIDKKVEIKEFKVTFDKRDNTKQICKVAVIDESRLMVITSSFVEVFE